MSFIDFVDVKARCFIEQAANLVAAPGAVSGMHA
jgi:hypothetical protein